MEYYELKGVELDDSNTEHEPSIYDCIEIKGEHCFNLLVSYYDVDRLIKALRQGKKRIDKYYKRKAKKEQSQNDR